MKTDNPPRWAIALFRWLSNDHLSEAVLGDLLELYDRRRSKAGKLKANLLFIWNVVQFIQPFAIRKRRRSTLNMFDMLRNYFKTAWRSMSRQKLYAGITIGGLALGLATCMMIFLFILNEESFDRHYKDGARIYRLYNDYNPPGDRDRWANIPTPLTAILKRDYADIEQAARIATGGLGNSKSNLVRRDDVLENTFEERFAYADPELLDILEVPMVYGNTNALDKPFTVVLTRRKAIQYFGDNDPIGKTIILNDNLSQPYIVSGVMEDFRSDSHFQYDFLLTLKDMEFWPGEQTNWCCWNYYTYVKLREGVDPRDFEKKLMLARDKYLIAYMRREETQNAEDFIRYHSFKLQPIAGIYLHPEISDMAVHGDAKYTWLFGGIAVFILVLACINFINLSTAKSANRAKEVGLRKVVGSLRKSLVTQFLAESTLYSVLSFVIALFILWISLPSFNYIAGRSLSIPWTSWWLLPSLIGASFMIGILAGSYPAFYLSAFKPIHVLKGDLRLGSKSGALRSSMVVFQFSASIMLLIGTLVIYRQMNFIMNHDTGFNKEQMMIIEGTGTLGNRKQAFKDELWKLPDVQSVSVSGFLPVAGGSREGYGFYLEGHEKTDRAVQAQKWRIDADYISTMGMKIVEGRDFNPSMASDSQAVVINEAMALQFGAKEPLGLRITNGNAVYTVIGVVANFNFATMKAPIRPLCFVIEGGGESSSIVRIQSSDLPSAINAIEKTWHSLMPHQPFRYTFLDERFARMYDDVLTMGRIFAGFATLAIVVACLGLFALSAFMTEQRSKEISIRLVMGASIKNIFRLLTGNFMKLVMISWLVGTPLAWYGMNQWLSEFTYREPIPSFILMAAGIFAIMIALITVSYQSIKAATTRPVENLRRD
jgi:putative ABC transport system permease protein